MEDYRSREARFKSHIYGAMNVFNAMARGTPLFPPDWPATVANFKDPDLQRIPSINFSAADNENAQQKSQIQALEKQIKKLYEDLEETKSKLTIAQVENITLKARHRVEVQDLTTKVFQLQENLQMMKPLVEVGVAIRLRYLEQAKDAHEIGEKGISQHVIRDGNIAAYGGNGAADAALSKLGVLKDDDTLLAVFKSLYKSSPKGFHQSSELLQRTLNYSATRRTSRKIIHNLENSSLCDKHLQLCCKIIRTSNNTRAWAKMQGHLWETQEQFNEFVAWHFESKVENWIFVDRLEWLTVELLNFDRQKSSSRWYALPVG